MVQYSAAQMSAAARNTKPVNPKESPMSDTNHRVVLSAANENVPAMANVDGILYVSADAWNNLKNETKFQKQRFDDFAAHDAITINSLRSTIEDQRQNLRLWQEKVSEKNVELDQKDTVIQNLRQVVASTLRVVRTAIEKVAQQDQQLVALADTLDDKEAVIAHLMKERDNLTALLAKATVGRGILKKMRLDGKEMGFDPVLANDAFASLFSDVLTKDEAHTVMPLLGFSLEDGDDTERPNLNGAHEAVDFIEEQMRSPELGGDGVDPSQGNMGPSAFPEDGIVDMNHSSTPRFNGDQPCPNCGQYHD